MGIIIGVLIGLLVLCCILLVFIVLLQDDGAEGAGIIFGSSASQQYGTRKGNIVTRTTGILAACFMVVSFVLAFLFKTEDNSQSLKEISTEKQASPSVVQWWNVSNTDENTDEISNEDDVDPSAVEVDSNAKETEADTQEQKKQEQEKQETPLQNEDATIVPLSEDSNSSSSQ